MGTANVLVLLRAMDAGKDGERNETNGEEERNRKVIEAVTAQISSKLDKLTTSQPNEDELLNNLMSKASDILESKIDQLIQSRTQANMNNGDTTHKTYAQALGTNGEEETEPLRTQNTKMDERRVKVQIAIKERQVLIALRTTDTGKQLEQENTKEIRDQLNKALERLTPPTGKNVKLGTVDRTDPLGSTYAFTLVTKKRDGDLIAEMTCKEAADWVQNAMTSNKLEEEMKETSNRTKWITWER
ncbi:hypothetical protein K435DRAFT_973268 [Dendrothele bispora CBS 962.96]|uniref:Uncharacterized protein n=1 Tax=Dendrothele bispora (strain CBS 962.96) TaxID=1314807 RepID=A0A4S8KTG8_DENBC|nr:hypothetical protein K435DRAFT_973268 [Dendrothele bispora CBS 962.96]